VKGLTLAILAALMPASAFAQGQVLRPDANGRLVIRHYDAEAITQWATCAWSKMPVSADNLVQYGSHERVPPDNGKIPFASAEELLNVRLNKVCGDLLPADHRNSRRPGIRFAKIDILKGQRPKAIGSVDTPIKAYLCAHKVGDRYVATEFELDKPNPRSGFPGGTTQCFVINTDGSLADA
jgi:hypothetical protein